MLTLMLLTRSEWSHQAESFLDDVPDEQSEQRDNMREQLHALNKPRPRIVWLETLDMEPLADPTSLLAALMVRLEELLRPLPESDHDRSAGEYQHPPGLPTDDVMDRLRSLLHDTVFAWDSIAASAAGKQEPHQYAESAIRAERKRLLLGRRLGSVLDGIARHLQRSGSYRNPLFVLPVDDVDLNPERGPAVLRLLRMITTPRLFTLVAGDNSYLSLVLQAEHLGRVNDLLRGGEALSVLRKPVEGLVSDTAINAMRKLIPPAQRVHVAVTDAQEALAYRPQSPSSAMANAPDSVPTLLSLLQTTFFSEESAWSEAASLADLLVLASSYEGRVSVQLLPYEAKQVLCAPIRKIVDLWHLLNRHKNFIRDNDEGQTARRRLRHLIAEAYRSELLGDPRLDETLRQQLLRTVLPQPDGGVLLDPQPYQPRRTLGYRGAFRDWKLIDGIQVRFEVPGSTVIVLQHDGAEHTLSHLTGSWLMLLHDAVQTAHLGGLLGRSLAKLQPRQPAVVSWPSTSARWPTPPFRTFFERDRFSASVSEASRHVLDDSTLEQNSTERLALAWIAASLSVGIRPKVPFDVGPEFRGLSVVEQRARVLDALDDLATDGNTRSQEQHEALLNAAVLLAPECGIPMGEAGESSDHSPITSWLGRIPRFTVPAELKRCAGLIRWWRAHKSEIMDRRRDSLGADANPLARLCIFPQASDTAAECLERVAGLMHYGGRSIFAMPDVPPNLTPETCSMARVLEGLRAPWIGPEYIEELLRHLQFSQFRLADAAREEQPLPLPEHRRHEILHWLRECRDRLESPDESGQLSVALWLHPINRILCGVVDPQWDA
ncbi:MAG: hypothetical protein KC503_37560 [Myxococcales bacterium]|nr:hypothetical protein [Myxococcales bacterium]